MIAELNRLVADIERCERTIGELKTELSEVNARYQTRASTREEIDYLSALLKVANKKLVWEHEQPAEADTGHHGQGFAPGERPEIAP